MPESVHSSEDLRQIYGNRFAGKIEYRQELWRVLSAFLAQWIPPHAAVLDLGCGYCEFINSIDCHLKFAMDLNPDAPMIARPEVSFLLQDCAEPWLIAERSLDTVFTSNFFEHLPSKTALEKTLQEAYKALKPGGRLIAMGPNIKYLPGAYWDFFDHYLPLTDLSLIEALKKCHFEIRTAQGRFLPYTMSHGRQYPLWVFKAYLAFRPAWQWFGKQFLVVAQKPQ